MIRTSQEHREALFEISSKVWEGEDYIPTVWESWMKEGGFYTIFHDKRIVGCMKATRLPENEVLFEGLRIDPDQREKGYASIAVDFFMRLVEDQGPNVIRFVTSDENKVSHHFGKKYGFEIVASFHHRYMERSQIREKKNQLQREETAKPRHPEIQIEEFRIDKFRQIGESNEKDLEEVISFIRESREWGPSHGLLSYGWVFHPITRERIMKEVVSGCSFVCRREGKMCGVLLAHPGEQYPDEMDISWLSGSDGQVIRALLSSLFLKLDLERIRQVSGKPPTEYITDMMEGFGFVKHPMVDCAVVFEKRLKWDEIG